LTLKDRAIRHMTTGLSTVEISSSNAVKLNTEFKKFFTNTNATYKSYVLKNNNEDKTRRLKALLDTHQIAYENTESGSVKGYDYSSLKEEKMSVSLSDIVVHTDQPKGKMVKALFEPVTKLEDSLTYDITAWSLPYAHGFKAIASRNKVNSVLNVKSITIKNNTDKSSYAYISKWNSVADATFLGALLKANITPRFSEKPFSIAGKSYQRGTLIILRNDNKNDSFDDKLVAIANKHQRKLFSVKSCFVSAGVDFGSYSVKPINKQNIAVLSGKETSSLSFGEIWHFFETQLHYPITNIDASDFENIKYTNYDVIIIPDGNYKKVLTKENLEKLKQWVQSGGTLIAIGNALMPFANKKEFSLKEKKTNEEKISVDLTPYAGRERKNVTKLITGSIFKSLLDPTHPLAFGYGKAYFSLKLGSTSFEYLKKGNNVAYFDETTKTVSGFAGSTAVKKVPKSLLFGEEKLGNGSIIYMVDNPLFRSFWENGKLFVANAVFLLNSDKLD